MPDRHQARQAAVQTARIELTRQPVYLDTETTGRDERDEIIEICLLEADGQVLLNSLVRATCGISPEASAVHGLTDGMLAEAPAWPAVWPQIETALAGRRVAIYNAAFDLRLLANTHRAHGRRWSYPEANVFCVMLLYAQFKGDWNPQRRSYRWHSLEAAGRQCSLTLPNAHRAHADALLARAVLHHMAGR